MPIDFADISVTTPTRDTLASCYAAIGALLDSGTEDGRREALAAWDRLRREIDSWEAMVRLRFQQDTADPSAQADRDYAHEIIPVATGFEVALKRRLLADPDRAGLELLVGAHATRLWEMDITPFEPAIAADLELEGRTMARYTE